MPLNRAEQLRAFGDLKPGRPRQVAMEAVSSLSSGSVGDASSLLDPVGHIGGDVRQQPAGPFPVVGVGLEDERC